MNPALQPEGLPVNNIQLTLYRAKRGRFGKEQGLSLFLSMKI